MNPKEFAEHLRFARKEIEAVFEKRFQALEDKLRIQSELLVDITAEMARPEAPPMEKLAEAIKQSFVTFESTLVTMAERIKATDARIAELESVVAYHRKLIDACVDVARRE